MNLYRLKMKTLKELLTRIDNGIEGAARMSPVWWRRRFIRNRVAVALNNKTYYGEDYVRD